MNLHSLLLLHPLLVLHVEVVLGRAVHGDGGRLGDDGRAGRRDVRHPRSCSSPGAAIRKARPLSLTVSAYTRRNTLVCLSDRLGEQSCVSAD